MAVAMQFDIFENSRDVMLRNDVVQALEQRDTAMARAALEILAKEYPQDEYLPPLRVLANAVAERSQTAFPDHEALRRGRLALRDEVQPAALRAFGDKDAAAWLRLSWKYLAQRAAPLAFRADRSEDHAAPLWLRAADFKAAADAVASIESWRRIPAPLAWMVHARLHLYGLQATWGMLAELAWLSPQRLYEVTQCCTDPSLPQLIRQFELSFEGVGDISDMAWFPAWVLTERPGLAAHLALAQPSQHGAPERAMRILIELLGLEHQGRHHDLVKRRKGLRDIHASLYAAYMRTR